MEPDRHHFTLPFKSVSALSAQGKIVLRHWKGAQNVGFNAAPMTIGKFIAEIEALVLAAKISGITSEQKIAVLNGIIDALKEAPQTPALTR
jgi:hypothetical protein